MAQEVIIRENTYYDSVTLMSIGNRIGQMDGVEEAVVVMATAMNKEILQKVGFADARTERAGVNDLVIAVRAADAACIEAAKKKVEELLNKRETGKQEKNEEVFHSLRQAFSAHPDRNMAVISVPGAYAAREARLALGRGMHVMLFSDNVPVEEERELKELAASRHLLLMGPDCGTALLGGVGLCFANGIRRGDIGVVGASGTGLQEVLVQIHQNGGGVSQAIGTGGRDLSAEIGGRMMLEGIGFLNEDADTKVIVLVSKPPHPTVEEKICKALASVKKPVVFCFLEGEPSGSLPENVHVCETLREAGCMAAAISRGEGEGRPLAGLEALAERLRSRLRENGHFVRGMFCGGTLCAEALMLLREYLPEIHSNISHRPEEKITGTDVWEGNVLIDLGEDEFTNGKPHPMLEPSLRSQYILEQMQDPETGVLLVDIELGWGSHPDPAGQLAKALKQGPDDVIVIGYLLGTDEDAQGYEKQKQTLEQAGVILMPSNEEAARLAGLILRKEEASWKR